VTLFFRSAIWGRENGRHPGVECSREFCAKGGVVLTAVKREVAEADRARIKGFFKGTAGTLGGATSPGLGKAIPPNPPHVEAITHRRNVLAGVFSPGTGGVAPFTVPAPVRLPNLPSMPGAC
jgi:hypothetical protein